YPAANASDSVQQGLIEEVSAGCGLLMIGGWESFHGAGGGWDQSALASILPVTMQSTDDRLNCDHPVLVRHVGEDSPVSGLPWSQRPPVVGGFNRFQPRSDATVVLEADRLAMS